MYQAYRDWKYARNGNAGTAEVRAGRAGKGKRLATIGYIITSPESQDGAREILDTLVAGQGYEIVSRSDLPKPAPTPKR
jgi:hypothetical protein